MCFDNAYDDLFTVPAREGTLDFHPSAATRPGTSGAEYDQMVAFAPGGDRDRALGRPGDERGDLGRIDPSGREVARLEDASGADRMVAGTLAAVVPVPAEGSAAARTPFVRLERLWIGLWLGLPFLLGFFVIRGGYTSFERG